MTRRLANTALTRRLTVLAIALCYLAAYAATLTVPHATLIWGALLACAFAALAVLFLLTRNVSNRFDSDVDERELQLRDRAHRIAYWSLSPLVGGVVAATHATAINQAANSHVQLSITLAFAPCVVLLAGLALLYTGLPTAIIAWLEPDDTDPEEPRRTP